MLIKNNKAAGLFSCHEDSNLSQKLVQLVNNEFIRNQGTHCEDTPVVTVIITTHKRPPKLVSRAVLSVCNQTYKNLEIIIVDDSPSDYAERMDVYESIKRIEDPRITYLFNEENVGACASRNRAIENSSGEFVMYVDDDDELLAECVEKRLEKFTAPEIGLVYGDCYTVNEVTGEKKQSNQDKYAGKVFDELIKNNFVYAFPMVRRECFDECGLFDVKMQAAQDCEMWLRIAAKYQFNYNKEALSIVHLHTGERISKNPLKKIQGFEQIDSLYEEYLKTHPDAYHIRMIKLAPFYRMVGERGKAWKLYFSAVKVRPFSIRTNLQYLKAMLSK